MRKGVLLGILALFVAFGLDAAVYRGAAEEEHALIVCAHGRERLDWDLEFIRHARHSIEVSGVFFQGKIAERFLAEIAQRLLVEPELQVHLLVIAICAEKENLHSIERLKEEYPDRFFCEVTPTVAAFSPDVRGVENHVKLCVVDGHYFSIGGTNITDYEYTEGTATPPPSPDKKNLVARFFAPGFRDGNVVGRGPLAQEMRRWFYALYGLWKEYNATFQLKGPEPFLDRISPPEEGEAPWVARFENSDRRILLPGSQLTYFFGELHQRHNTITEAYIRLIREAKEEICLSHMFVFPVDPLFDALVEAARRGVRLTLITNGTGGCAPGANAHFAWANRLSYVPFFYGKEYKVWDYFTMKREKLKNTHIYEYGVPEVLLHKKVMIVDGHLVMIGSYNLGLKSDKDHEMNLLIDSVEVAAAARQLVEEERALSREITPDQAVSWYFDPGISYVGRLQRMMIGGLCL